MAPAGDMKRSYNVMLESFYLSNMCPQTPGLYRGLWKTLEERIRDFTKIQGEVWIICGPVFKDIDGDGIGDYLDRIGLNQVWVPSDFYKILIFQKINKDIKATAFIMPNRRLSGDLLSYVVTIDSIEGLTGLDFLNELPDSIEEKIESTKLLIAGFWGTTPE
jgi:endonuclease G